MTVKKKRPTTKNSPDAIHRNSNPTKQEKLGGMNHGEARS